jgi:hypothetical protein
MFRYESWLENAIKRTDRLERTTGGQFADLFDQLDALERNVDEAPKRPSPYLAITVSRIPKRR